MLKLNLKKFTQKWNKKKGNPGNKMKKPQSDWSKWINAFNTVDTPFSSPKSWHKHCLQLLLGRLLYPGEIKNKGNTHFWGGCWANTVYHGRCANGEFQRNEGPTVCFIPFDLQFVSQKNPSLTKSSQEQSAHKIKAMIMNVLTWNSWLLAVQGLLNVLFLNLGTSYLLT